MTLRPLWFLPVALFLAAQSACTETPVSLPLRSLERSGEVSFACVSTDGQGAHINVCPDFDGERRMLALVTQTLRGEVAVVDLSAGSVVDYDPSTPGFNFIPVGENPVDIVTTPGGVASFVGIGGTGRAGIVGLPSTCLRRPAQDLTTWPACSLPKAPGQMHVLVDRADDQGRIRASCDTAPTPDAATAGTAIAASREVCPADLALEVVEPGRRKLLVEIPDLGGIAVIDAQELLDRPPGSFDPCSVERFLPLDVQLPAGDTLQPVPPDLQAPGCVAPEVNYGPPANGFLPRPSGFEVADDKLYVADLAAPVVHVIDAKDPCTLSELPPLLPVSFESRNRVVTTRKVAVSPPTREGRRFLYSIDDFEGSVMIFDVTPGNADRTPIVRPGSPLLPFEPADRISFSSPARDISFALRDAPITDPQTGVGTVGTLCDPDPELDLSSPAAKYRTTLDYTRGARPRQLRGVFGFVALASGQIAVVDVEDWDAACRRPVRANSDPAEDFRGCAGDPKSPESYTLPGDDNPTVSVEASCRVVEAHRARSGSFVVSNNQLGARAPGIRSLPRLRAAEGGNLPTDQSEEGKQNPKLLAVDFAAPGGGAEPAELYVSTNLYQRGSPNAATELVIEPASADDLSLSLMRRQPRAFAEEDVLVEYEGLLSAERPAGFLQIGAPGAATVLRDADGSFCNRGIEDAALAAEVAADMGVAANKRAAYSARHADYVQITSELRAEDDRYWTDGAGKSCGGASGKAAFLGCRTDFGTSDTPSDLRDFRVTEARQNELTVEPRNAKNAADRQSVLDRLACCFGGSALRYRLRAGHQWIVRGGRSGFRHNVVADADLRCIRDCNPRRSLLRSRILEVSSSSCKGPDCGIGSASSADVACVVSGEKALAPGGAGAECIFENLLYRFAIYRGTAPTERDMAFSFQLIGGFTPLVANLAAQTAAVSPQSMTFVPQLGQLAVVDGAAEGLVLVSLDTVGISRLFF
jgi:hypothetical protein